MLFHFLARVAPEGVMLSPDIGAYLDFTMKLLLVFGGLFEIPIVMLLLVSTGIVTRARFISTRSYAILGAFVVGMLLAPPDVLSMTALAVPIWLLYELGIFLSRFIREKSNDKKG
jgi:sec-independent protein translocase protein TatC